MKTVKDIVTALRTQGATKISQVETKLFYLRGTAPVPAYKIEFLAGTLLLYDGLYTPGEDDEELEQGKEYFVATLFPYNSHEWADAEDCGLLLMSQLGIPIGDPRRLSGNEMINQESGKKMVEIDATDEALTRFFSMFLVEEGDAFVKTIAEYGKSWVGWAKELKQLSQKWEALSKKKGKLSKGQTFMVAQGAIEKVGYTPDSEQDPITSEEELAKLEKDCPNNAMIRAVALSRTFTQSNPSSELSLSAAGDSVTLNFSVVCPSMPGEFGAKQMKIRSSNWDVGMDQIAYGDSHRKILCYVAQVPVKWEGPLLVSIPDISLHLDNPEEIGDLLKALSAFNEKYSNLFNLTTGAMFDLFGDTPLDFTPDDEESGVPEGDTLDSAEGVWLTGSK